MKPHYFDQEQADQDDIHLNMAKGQGYVPQGCLLGGDVVMRVVTAGKDPCKGCKCSRAKCQGRKGVPVDLSGSGRCG